ncbi:MAG: hypothetical protein DA407_03510 [Bacteroidetes bacterium]|nr:MAG: hypothetical protein DA407_03510 [Bacteroidota bacterium]
MISKFKLVLILSFFALLSFNSCQDEILEVSETDEETLIAPNSTLANLMQFTVSNDGSVDDVMDDANCFSVNLPVTIIVNDITITISTLEDLALIEDIFNEFESDDDILEFLFPITIILNDYDDIIIENEDQLEDFIEECVNDDNDDVIECIDFQYPISFSIYNTEFQVIDTVVIEGDEQLYEFLENLQNETDQVVLASLNFPVTMVYANGNTVEVNNNSDLEAAINEAGDDCDDDNEDDDCSEEEVDAYLTECYWNIVNFNGDDNFINNDIYFNNNGLLEIYSENNVIATGNWSTSMSDLGVILTLSELTMFDEDLGGNWYVYECDDDRFKFTREPGTVESYIIIERECNNESDCNVAEIQADLKECKWYLGTDLVDGNGPLMFTEDGVKLNGNVIGGWNLAQIEGYIYLTLDLSGDYMNISKEWKLVECDDDRLQFINGDYTLVLEQDCENNNSIGCLEANAIVLCDENNDGFEVFNLYEGLNDIEGCDIDNAVSVSYHTTLVDAETDVNEISGVTSYTNISSPQTIYVRIEVLNNPSVFEILEMGLSLQDCSNSGSVEDLEAIIVNGSWVVASYIDSGDNDTAVYANYTLEFSADGSVVATDGGSNTFYGTWDAFLNTGGDLKFLLDFGAQIPFDEFNDDWLVIDLQTNRIELYDLSGGDGTEDFLVFERL